MWQGNRGNLELIVIYTGDGKGKTCACVGQALRALGSGLSVAFGQFMKRPERAGEQKMLAALLGGNFLAAGPGFFKTEEQREFQKQKAWEILAWANSLDVDMLVLDEIFNALAYGFVQPLELEPLLVKYSTDSRHLIMSGRDAPQWLEARADIVTRMRNVKHYFQRGMAAVAGLEY